MVRMVVIDDEYYIRTGIRDAIDWQSINVEIVGEAEDGEQGMDLILSEKPDLVITDIRMPFMDGLELIKRITENEISCGIIVLSGFDEFEYAQAALRNGVLDYLLKPIDKASLKETVQKACQTIRNRRSVQHYRQLVDEGTSAIRTQFLKDLLFDRIHDQTTVSDKIRNLELPFHNGSCQVICVKLDDYRQLEYQFSVNELQDLKDHLVSLLSERLLLGRTFMGILVEISPEEYAVLLTFLDPPAPEECESELHSTLQLLQKDLKDYSSHTVSIRVSSRCRDLSSLPAAYRAARLANDKYIPGSNSVVWPNHQLENVRPEVQKALAFIRQHYNEDISIQQAADSLYLSPYYLMHIFKSDTGKTFHTFLTEYRMETAKEMLRTPGCRIYEIALQIGYTDVKYFNKLFKKYTSLTPSEYIRMYYAKI